MYDGGPAFPHAEHNGDGTHYIDHTGMSVRAYLAGRAMQGLLANSVYIDNLMKALKGDTAEAVKVTNKFAVEHADDMLRVLGLVWDKS